MPPRKKSPQPVAAPASIDPSVITGLAKEIAHLEEQTLARVAGLESEHAAMQLTLAEHRKGYERLLIQAVGRISEVEKNVTGLVQHNKDHDIAAATRRAAIASRVKSLEGQIQNFLRTGTDTSLVHEEQLSQVVRNVWFAMAGLGVVVFAVAVKTFVG